MRVIKALIVVVFLAVTIVFSANYYKEKTEIHISLSPLLLYASFSQKV